MSDNKRIPLCNHCDKILVSTMAFSGAEYYCPHCGSTFGMLDINRFDATEADLKLQAVIDKEWRKCMDGMFGGGMRRRDCKKCDEGDYHIHHLTIEEVKLQEKSLQMLKDFKTEGYFEKLL